MIDTEEVITIVEKLVKKGIGETKRREKREVIKELMKTVKEEKRRRESKVVHKSRNGRIIISNRRENKRRKGTGENKRGSRGTIHEQKRICDFQKKNHLFIHLSISTNL